MRKAASVLTVLSIALIAGLTLPQMGQDYPDAVTADPDHYSVEFENDMIRVLRIKYGPGEKSVMHHHPANCSVILSPTTWEMANAEGEVIQNVAPMGAVGCSDAEVHLPTNATDQVGEVVLIELKGRKHFEK